MATLKTQKNTLINGSDEKQQLLFYSDLCIREGAICLKNTIKPEPS